MSVHTTQRHHIWGRNLNVTTFLLFNISLCGRLCVCVGACIYVRLDWVTENDIRGVGFQEVEWGEIACQGLYKNHRLIGLGIFPQSKFKPLWWGRIELSLFLAHPPSLSVSLFEQGSSFSLGMIVFRQPANKYRKEICSLTLMLWTLMWQKQSEHENL